MEGGCTNAKRCREGPIVCRVSKTRKCQTRFHSEGAKVEIEEQESAKLVSQLDRCLVGSLNPFPLNLEEAGKEMFKGWRLTGDLGLSDLGDGKVPLQFAAKGDELRVLQKGSRSFKSFKVELCC